MKFLLRIASLCFLLALLYFGNGMINNSTSRSLIEVPLSSEVDGLNNTINRGTPLNKNLNTLTKWPNIVYKGCILNDEANVAVALLELNGSEELLNEGELLSGVTVINVSEHELKLRYNNTIKTYPLIEG